MRREAADGFTLLEVLVAFVIAAFALAALFSGGLGGLQAAAVSGRYTEAVSRAQSHLAATAGDALTAGDRQGDEGAGFHWRVRIVPTLTALPAPGASRGDPVLALYAVSAAVSWTEEGRTRAVQLDTMRGGGAGRGTVIRPPVMPALEPGIRVTPPREFLPVSERNPPCLCQSNRVDGRVKPCHDGSGNGGFTLLEVLVALVVLGFVLAGIAGGVQFGQRAADMQARSIASHADMGAADRLLRQLVAEMDPGTANEAPRITGGASALGFVTDLGRAASALGEGQAEIGLGVDPQHRLVMRWVPALHAIRFGPATPPQTAVLLDSVERVEFAYWSHGQGGAGQWLPGWTERDIPPLIRIRLRFLPEAHRVWPDIIAPTQRLRTGS